MILCIDLCSLIDCVDVEVRIPSPYSQLVVLVTCCTCRHHGCHGHYHRTCQNACQYLFEFHKKFLLIFDLLSHIRTATPLCVFVYFAFFRPLFFYFLCILYHLPILILIIFDYMLLIFDHFLCILTCITNHHNMKYCFSSVFFRNSPEAFSTHSALRP